MIELEITSGDGAAMYGRIAEAVCEALASGRVAEGDRLPAETDLAKHLGVNRLTVSRAYDELRGRGIVVRRRRVGTHIAPDALRRVRAGGGRRIERLAIAAGVKSLAEGRREYLFIWTEIFAGLRDVLGERQTEIDFVKSFTPEEIHGVSQYDAVILLQPRPYDPALVGQIYTKRIPVVSMWEPKISPTIPHVDFHRFRAPALACQKLLECGYRRIGFLGSHRFDSQRKRVSEKYAVFAAMLQQADLDVRARYVRHAEWQPGRAYAAARDIVDAGDLPEAFFVDSDYKAMEVVCALNDAGLKVPDDVGIVSQDDNPDAATFHPPLTTVRAPRREMGRRAAELLLNWPGDGSVPEDVILEPELVERQSTKG